MCLPNFKEFKQIDKSNPLIGYRNWRLPIGSPTSLISESQDYSWKNIIEGPHEVLEFNSGIYAYNYNSYYNNNNSYYHNNNSYHNNNNYYNNNNSYHNNNYYYHNNNNYYHNNNYYNYNYYDYYYIGGIISQWGKVAIHDHGQRSEYAKINKLFTIRESDANGTIDFINWIKKFNLIIEEVADEYNCETIHFQDFMDSTKTT